EEVIDYNTVLKQVKKLSVRMDDNKTHDMGFIFGPSSILGNNIKNDEFLTQMAIAGSKNMQDLLQEEVGLVLAWDEPNYEGVAIVDTIMNVPLMIWAANLTNNQELFNQGIRVADNIKKHHIRDDYSIHHVVRWD